MNNKIIIISIFNSFIKNKVFFLKILVFKKNIRGVPLSSSYYNIIISIFINRNNNIIISIKMVF